MKTFIKWFAGFFEDKVGTASSKRLILYWAMFLLTYMTTKGMNGIPVNMEMYWTITGLILAGLGMVTSEFFKTKPFINASNQTGGTN